jgi:hypothetical protein
MNIAIIGARRERNGIGSYIARYFHLNGARVACVLDTSEATAASAAEGLASYGIKARPYHDFTDMVEHEDLGAVAVASPLGTHYAYLSSIMEHGLSVFCEKPFLDPARDNLPGDLDTLFHLARAKGVTVAMNSQWPFCLPSYEELFGTLLPSGVRTFSIRLSPLSEGADMIPDSVPHALSLLYAVLGTGMVQEISFEQGADSLRISFVYSSDCTDCEADILLVRETTQPRTFSFGFNGRVAERIIDMKDYSLSLAFGEKMTAVPDPLNLSVRDFVTALEAGLHPFIGSDHIISTSLNLKQIYNAYSQQERASWKN